jgi:hypothetical protein
MGTVMRHDQVVRIKPLTIEQSSQSRQPQFISIAHRTRFVKNQDKHNHNTSQLMSPRLESK